MGQQEMNSYERVFIIRKRPIAAAARIALKKHLSAHHLRDPLTSTKCASFLCTDLKRDTAIRYHVFNPYGCGLPCRVV